MSAVYATVDGALVEEDRGGVVTCYVPDALGSVVATTDASGSVTSRTEYWPYGEVRSSTGTNPSPWGFCGAWGYLGDAAARLYVRARTYRPREGRWNTLDPLWPEEGAYAYADGDPVGRPDPSGLQADPWSDWCRGMDREWRETWEPVFRGDWIPRLPPPQVPPVWGKYCGPQTQDGKGRAQDATDGCCKSHDECFGKHGCNVANQSLRKECRRCNHALCGCLASAKCRSVPECAANRAFRMIYCRQPFTNYPRREF